MLTCYKSPMRYICILLTIKCEIETTMPVELQERRRKVVNLKMKKDVAAAIRTPTQSVVNKNTFQ